MPDEPTSIGTAPQHCTASTKSSAPAAWQSAAIASTGMRRPVWNSTALTATRRTPRASSRWRRARPCSSLAWKSATGIQAISRPNIAAARCQGVTLAGNSPSKRTTRSPRRQGKQSAMSITPRVVLGMSAMSAPRAPMSRAICLVQAGAQGGRAPERAGAVARVVVDDGEHRAADGERGRRDGAVVEVDLRAEIGEEAPIAELGRELRVHRHDHLRLGCRRPSARARSM